MKTLLTAIYNMLFTLSPAVKAVIAGFSILLAINSYVNELWADIFSRVDAMAAASFSSVDFAPLALVNYIFPLDTVLSFIVAYSSLRLVCATIRIIKSFIPTIS